MNLQYRKEIDGLRAIAVIPVILFHAGFNLLSGGYIGVDVFFVISGFLITNILIAELEAGNFSILKFYERRARRILPALFFVMLCCVPFAWAWMMPEQFKDFGQSFIAVSLFASNILFWKESGYFDTAAEEKPLLHTWSLAVEEQYYMLFPIALILLWRFGRQPVFYVITGFAIASLLLSELTWRTYPDANFYLAPTRAWELFAGSICAFLQFGKTQKSNNTLATAGLALIVFSIFYYDEFTPFPSLYALAPVVGTALIILFATGGTGVARLLSAKPLVGIGLISYSAYLWHQPLFAFARIQSIEAPAEWLMLLLAFASLALAYLTWRFVEQPFRRRPIPVLAKRRNVFLVSAIFVALFGAFGSMAHWTAGFPTRLDGSVLHVLNRPKGDTTDCHNKYNAAQIRAGSTCILGSGDQEPTIAFVGDSHLARISDSLSLKLEPHGLSAVTYTGSFCAPLLEFGTTVASKNPSCRQKTTAALKAIVNNQNIEIVVLFAQWSYYVNGQRGYDKIVTPYRFGSENTDPQQQNSIAVHQALDQTLSLLTQANKKVLVIRPVPEFNFDVPNKVAQIVRTSAEIEILAMHTKTFRERNAEISQIFDKAVPKYGAIQIDPTYLFCDAQKCRPFNEKNEPLFEDESAHLNLAGSQPLAALIYANIEQLLN
ncbi:MAG: acyltransferase family protein [Paracoccaceae bacterium]